MTARAAQDRGDLHLTPPAAATGAQRWTRRTLRNVRAVIVVVVALLGALSLAVGAILFFHPWDTALPPASENPPLPSDVTVTSTDSRCGSGGCWRELTVRGDPGEAPSSLADRLGLTREICHEQPGPTPRRVCADAEPSDDHLVVRVRYVDGLG